MLPPRGTGARGTKIAEVFPLELWRVARGLRGSEIADKRGFLCLSGSPPDSPTDGQVGV